MISGSIVKIVDTYGSQWGHVRPTREPRQLFFNVDSLVEGADGAPRPSDCQAWATLLLATAMS